MKKWIKEIRAVGFIDWFWFVVWLKRDEFNIKLSVFRYYPNMIRLNRDRKRAHEIDIKLCIKSHNNK